MQLFWLDLETEGLSPANCSILEIAVSVADLATPFDAVPVYHAVLRMTPEAIEALRKKSAYVFDMHTRNGLLAECAASSTEFPAAEQALLAIVPPTEGVPYEDRPTLAGSSVHFDHDFLKYWMPTLAARFSHRHYDVSAVKLFCRSLGMDKPLKAEAHRAQADVLESITHAKLCRDWLAVGEGSFT